MKIEAGKYYRTRGGDVVGPMRHEGADSHFPWITLSRCWTIEGKVYRGREGGEDCMDLISEVYVSDTPPAFMRLAGTPSDDTVVSFNFSEMARDGNKWATGSIGFWIGGEMRMAHYDVRLTGLEGRASPSDALPTDGTCKFTNCSIGTYEPAPKTKTLRDELVEKAALAILNGHYANPSPMSSYGFEEIWLAAEHFVEARKK